MADTCPYHWKGEVYREDNTSHLITMHYLMHSSYSSTKLNAAYRHTSYQLKKKKPFY